MKTNLYIFILLITFINGAQADVFTNDLADGNAFLTTINDHAKAYKRLSEEKGNISVNISKEFIYDAFGRPRVERFLNYSFTTPQAYATLENYKKIFEEFSNKALARSAGEAFLLGSAIALINKALSGETFNKKALCCAIAAALSLIVYQSRTYKVPYFDDALQSHENFFGLFDMTVLPQTAIATLAAIASYAGISYGLNKLSSLITAKKLLVH